MECVSEGSQCCDIADQELCFAVVSWRSSAIRMIRISQSWTTADPRRYQVDDPTGELQQSRDCTFLQVSHSGRRMRTGCHWEA